MGHAYQSFIQHARALKGEVDQVAAPQALQRILGLLAPWVPQLVAAIAEHETFDFNINGDLDEEEFPALRRALKPWTKYDEAEEEFGLQVTDAAGLVAELMRLLHEGAAGKAVAWKRLRALARVPLAGAEWQFAEWHAAGSGEVDALYKSFLAAVFVLLESRGQEPMSEIVEPLFEGPHPVDVLGYMAWKNFCSLHGSRAVTFEEVANPDEEQVYAELSQSMSDLWHSSGPAKPDNA